MKHNPRSMENQKSPTPEHWQVDAGSDSVAVLNILGLLSRARVFDLYAIPIVDVPQIPQLYPHAFEKQSDIRNDHAVIGGAAHVVAVPVRPVEDHNGPFLEPHRLTNTEHDGRILIDFQGVDHLGSDGIVRLSENCGRS